MEESRRDVVYGEFLKGGQLGYGDFTVLRVFQLELSTNSLENIDDASVMTMAKAEASVAEAFNP